MLGAIVGDIIGSHYEIYTTKKTTFKFFMPNTCFTDDTVMTLAVAKWLTDGCFSKEALVKEMQTLGRKYSDVGALGYGAHFYQWLFDEDPQPYNSWGNGSAMRVSPVGLFAKNLEEALDLAKISAEVTHNHPEGIKGAQAIAACIYLVRIGQTKEEIQQYIESTFGYNLHRKIAEIRPTYGFDESCQGTVPESIIAFLEGNDFEEVIRLAISLGGDSDTIGAMAGSIAAALYGIPKAIADPCDAYLTPDLRKIMLAFEQIIS